jgi:arylsulfatase A-like enzyme
MHGRLHNTARTTIAGAAATFGCLLLAAVGGCDRREPARQTRAWTAARRPLPNIIMLTVDTLRADHMALYGYQRETMPAVQAFADTAVVFDNAVVPRGSTRPSYASMLTGLYPFHHGVRCNGSVLNADLVTLPEVLQAVGYHTAGFVSNFVLVGELSGFDQGFDVYDDRVEEREPNRPNYERTAANTLRAILQWLASDPPKPFFLFTNFIDPHGPYHPPQRFREMFHSTEQRQLSDEDIPAYQRIEGEHNYFDYVDRYDGEIRYVDEALGLLIEQLKAQGLWDDAVVIFTADHGESMGEHGIYFTHHLHVWEETVRVPLVVRLPQTLSPRRVQSLCSPMDLMPTLLEYLHITPAGQFDGRSLLPLMEGETGDNRTVFLEFPNVATPQASYPDEYAVRTQTHKLIRVYDPTNGRLEMQAVFDVATDPNEQKPIPFDATDLTHRRLAERFDSILAELHTYKLPFTLTVYEMPNDQRSEFVHSRPASKRLVKPLTEDQIDKLRSLGYVD